MTTDATQPLSGGVCAVVTSLRPVCRRREEDVMRDVLETLLLVPGAVWAVIELTDRWKGRKQ